MRILVLGGHGWVGRELVAALARAGHETAAPRRAELDITDALAVARAFDAFRPDAVVNAAAANTGTTDPARLDAVNVDAASIVAREARRRGARLVHVSTDLVLDGRHPPYADDAAVAPVNAYGRSKAAGEGAVRSEDAGAAIVRASHVFDPATPDPSLAGFAERLARGETVRLFVDEFRCPVERRALASALVELTALPFAGTLNVAGQERISRFDYGSLLLEHFAVPGRERVERARAADLSEPRPLDLTLDTRTARRLLVTPLVGVREAIRRAR